MSVAEESPSFSARLLIDCADRPGIVAAVSGFLHEQGANIVSSHQYSSDATGGRFYMRTEFFLQGLSEAHESFERDFEQRVAGPLQMEWELRYWGERKRMAILVSRHDHCLMDLLWRRRRGELDAEIVAVVSNHPDLAEEVRVAGVPFHHVPVVASEKAAAERQTLELLSGQVDLVVLARYMQILSGDFLERLAVPVINIHHSFLPAFAGAEPYRRAREHGVKLIGATAHYVTAELDGGPIIEQDVARVDHRQTVTELERIGRDIERTVLARAVTLHLEDRVIADAGRTIVL
ncbi:MAG TPA: formyltetrahydrofolate deformylase [Solirubrobacteraceae bacterium]|nr:formyltetrahydrofolate deformylase [Solirubrobacteraceae bacterium]